MTEAVLERASTKAPKGRRPSTPSLKSSLSRFRTSIAPRQFYAGLGWRLDADFASGDDWRVIQFTPPGSPASVIFGKNVTAAAAGLGAGTLSDRL